MTSPAPRRAPPPPRRHAEDRDGGRGRRPRRRGGGRTRRADAGAFRVGGLDRAHRALRRTAQRRALRLHAAARRRSTSTWNWSRRSKRTAAGAPACRSLLEGYPPPHDPRLRAIQHHARSRRHRGEHPAGGELGRARRADDDALRRRAPGAPHDREVHARRPPHGHRRRQPLRARRPDAPPTARFCGGPICCGAWSRTGTIIRRCRICSPGCSSARRARRRASTRRATTASTSSSIAFRALRAHERRRRRRGWSIGCSATCSST